MQNPVKAIWSNVKGSKLPWLVLVGLVLFGGGYFAGCNRKVPTEVKEKLVEDVVSKQKLKEQMEINLKLQEQLNIKDQTITDLKSHVRVVERIVIKPGGETIVDRTTDTDTSVKTDTKTDTSLTKNTDIDVKDNKDLETDLKSHKEVEKIATPVNTKPWFVGPFMTWVPSAPVGQQFYGGLVFGRYLGEIPIIKVPVSASVSLSVPIHKPVSVPSPGAAVTFGF